MEDSTKDVLARVYQIRQDDKLDYVDIFVHIMEEFGLEEEDLANIIKEDKTLFNLLKAECERRNLLKRVVETKKFDLNDIF